MDQAVLVIYAGGTIGMVPRHADDPRTPLVPGSWSQLIQWAPQLDRIGVPIEAVSIAQPKDSSDITHREWIEIAHLIRDHYHTHRGFVILHGTDTMAYTATALAFMLRNLTKPVVVTGAQLPITAPRTDAVQNFVSALTIAGGEATDVPVVPEVCLFFRTHLLRGCRTTKISARSYDAFVSPNYPPLGEAGHRIEIFSRRLRRARGTFRVRDALAHGVITLRLTPDLHPAVLEAVLKQPQVKGAILETFGAGNAPTNGELLRVIGDAITSGKHIVNVTQCLSGQVDQGRYQASAGLLDAGVISGTDMTTEAALIKLQVLLAEHGDDHETVSHLMEVDAVGEQSLSICNAGFGGGTLTDVYRSESRRFTGTFDKDQIQKALLRLFRAAYTGQAADGELFRVYVNLPPTVPEPGPTASEYAGVLRRTGQSGDQPEVLAIDVTDVVRRGIILPDEPVRFSLFGCGSTSVQWHSAELSVAVST